MKNELKPIAYAPTKEVKEFAAANNLDLITAWVHIEAKECGIKDDELPKLLELFNGYMNQHMTAENSLKASLQEIILHIPNLPNTPKTNELPPDPIDYDIIRQLIDKLLILSEHTDMKTNDVALINDDIDEIEVRYFENVPDGDRQNEIFEKNLPRMNFKEAFNLLHVRINNSLTSIGY